MRHLDVFRRYSQINWLSDQPARDRIRVVPPLNRAACADTNPGHPVIRVEAFIEQRSQRSLLFRESGRTIPIRWNHDLVHESDVFVATVRP